MQLLEARRVAGERPALVRRPAPRVLGLDLQVHDGVAGERLAHPLGLDRASAERHHGGVAAREQLADDLLLARAEGRLALAVEERLDCLAQTMLELAVAVERLDAQLRGQRAGPGGLAGAHEADQDDRPVYRARLHPIRSTYASSAARASSMWSPPSFSR